MNAQLEQSVIFYDTLWYWIAVFDLNGLVWPRMVFSLLFTTIYMFSLVWPCLVLYGLFMAIYGLLWPNIVFSRGHRSKFIWSCSSCLISCLVISSTWPVPSAQITSYQSCAMHAPKSSWRFSIQDTQNCDLFLPTRQFQINLKIQF